MLWNTPNRLNCFQTSMESSGFSILTLWFFFSVLSLLISYSSGTYTSEHLIDGMRSLMARAYMKPDPFSFSVSTIGLFSFFPALVFRLTTILSIDKILLKSSCQSLSGSAVPNQYLASRWLQIHLVACA